MSDPIWKRTDININEHRLIWFLVDVGCMNSTAGRGWLNKCAEQMGWNRHTVRRMVTRLVAKGLLRRPCKGNVEFNPDGFVSTLPEDFVRMKKVENGDAT